MYSSVQPCHGLVKLLPLQRFRTRTFIARAHSPHEDERKSAHNMVDANMGVLKQRIESIKMKERMNKCRLGDYKGWDYYQLSNDDNRNLNRRKVNIVSNTLEIAGVVVGTFGFTVLACTICLCLFSALTQVL